MTLILFLWLLRILAFILGIVIVVNILASAIRSFVLPRSAPDQLSRAVFVTMRQIFQFRMRGTRSYEERDRIMGDFLQAAQQWVNFYNTTRPHESLDYRSPDQYAKDQQLGSVPYLTLF